MNAQYWMVAAYDPAFSSTCSPAQSGLTAACGTGALDYVKIMALAGGVPTNHKAPEPGTLLLLGLAGAVGAWSRRRFTSRQ